MNHCRDSYGKCQQGHGCPARTTSALVTGNTGESVDTAAGRRVHLQPKAERGSLAALTPYAIAFIVATAGIGFVAGVLIRWVAA